MLFRVVLSGVESSTEMSLKERALKAEWIRAVMASCWDSSRFLFDGKRLRSGAINAEGSNISGAMVQDSRLCASRRRKEGERRCR